VVKCVVVASTSWWGVVKRLCHLNLLLLVLTLLIVGLLWLGLSGGGLAVHIHGKLVLWHMVGIEMDIFVVVSANMMVWGTMISLNDGLVVVIMWSLPAVIDTSWVRILLVYEWGRHLNVMVLYSMVDLSLDVMEELVVRVFNIMDHLGTEMIISIVVVIVSWVVGVAWTVVFEVLSQMGIVVSIAMEVLIMVLVVVWSYKFWCHIMDPVIWLELKTVDIVVVIDLLWVVHALISVAIVKSMVTINSSIKVMVLAMAFSSEVTLVSEMRLMILKSPVTLVEMCKVMRVLSHDSGGVVWINMSMCLVWSQVVMWKIPSIMERIVGRDMTIVSFIGSFLSWSSWSHVLSLLSGGSARSNMNDLVLSCWRVGELSNVWCVIAVWHVARVVPWVSIPRIVASVWGVVAWVHPVAPFTSVWVLVGGHSPWSSMVSVREVVQLVRSVAHSVRVSKFVVSVAMMQSDVFVLISWKDLALGFVAEGWLCLGWDHVSWTPDICMEVLVEVWLHLEHEVSIEDVGLRCTEGGAVCIEGGIVRLVPSV